MSDDKTNRGEPDRSLVSENEKYEREYFRNKLKAKNPLAEANLTDSEIDEIMHECFRKIAPSRSREKMESCVYPEAIRRASLKWIKP